LYQINLTPKTDHLDQTKGEIYKMKKIALSLIFLMCVGLLIMTLPAADPETKKEPDTSNKDNDGSGGGGTVTWDRTDLPCYLVPKEKTYCFSGGNQQCTTKYCN
jgi:hypothetical protein